MENTFELIPHIMDNKYYFTIQYYGTNEQILKLNNELIELNEGFLIYYKEFFEKITLRFKLEKKENQFKGMMIDNYYLNLHFYINLTLYNNNIIMELYYDKIFYSCTGLKKQHKYFKKIFDFIPLDVKEMNINNKQNEKFIDYLVNSFIGLKNLGGTCSISSIIQVLIHTKCFLKEFFSLSCSQNKISTLLYKLFISIIESKNVVYDFYYFCKELEKEIEVIKNDPMYFCTKLLEKLEEENPGKIMHLFSGKKKIEFQNLQDYNSEENFLFYIIHINFEGPGIKDSLFQQKQIDLIDNINNQIFQNEYLIEEPQIFMINVEKDENCKCEFYYHIPKYLTLKSSNYKLYAINKYDNVHSRV